MSKIISLRRVDGRTIIARRYREVVERLLSELGPNPTAAQEQLARRAATIMLWCEQRESEAATGVDIDMATFVTATNALRRVLSTLGIKGQCHPAS